MVTPIASRFAVLPVDDDGDTSRRITAKSLKKKEAQQSKQQMNSGTKQDTKKKQNKKKPDQVRNTFNWWVLSSLERNSPKGSSPHLDISQMIAKVFQNNKP